MVDALLLVFVLTFLAGLAIPLGGLLAKLEHVKMGEFRQNLLHGIVAFGGGILLAAVALVLVPEGMTVATIPEFVVAFSAGALAFLAVDRFIEVRGGRAGQVLSMTSDYVPESIALGAAFGIGGTTGPLLALFIGLQNLPEAFNSYRELMESRWRDRRIFTLLGALVFLGPAAGLLGFLFLAAQPRLLAGLFLFAAGGILYSVFHDIAPMAHRRRHWVPTLGAIIGFLLGMVATALVGMA